MPRSSLLRLLPVLPVLVAMLALVAGPSTAGAEPADRVTIPRTYAQALAHFDSATEMRSLKKFYTPSGNIYCSLGATTLKGCEIGEGRIHDPAACRGNPMSKTVGRLEFRRFKVQPVCNTDTIRTPRTKVLPYGQATAVGSLACISETIGVTCLNTRSELGFFLHRGEYVLFSGDGG
jgi:hypothetical protein